MIKIQKFRYSVCFVLLLMAMPFISIAQSSPKNKKANHSFNISFVKSVSASPVTGRVFIAFSKDSVPEPRFQAGSYLKSVPFWAKDVDQLQPDKNMIIDGSVLGFPIADIDNLPKGDYFVQAVLNVYTQYRRADGHTIWAHQDQWEGQRFNRSPGNIISSVQKIHYDPSKSQKFFIKLDSILPPITLPEDSKQVKRFKIKSKILSDFWGHDMYLGASILLPKGYDEHPNVHYPVVYEQVNFSLGAPAGFSTGKSEIPPEIRKILESNNVEDGYQFQEHYNSENFPRMIIVNFQHPTPYGNNSYTVNSANNGPYGDAIMEELIPYIENQYRIIKKPYARLLTGASTGGWESLSLQIRYPDFFGGTWALCPDPIDFRHFQLIDLTKDTNAFYANTFTTLDVNTKWIRSPRYLLRDDLGQPIRTIQDACWLESVSGSRGRSANQYGIWHAVFGPVGEDGYPVPLWDKFTGKIDTNAVHYAQKNGYDLLYYLSKNWADVGPKLLDKINVYVGDSDNFYLNIGVHKLQEFLRQTEKPHYKGTFEYGYPMKGHGWQPFPTSQLLKVMARHIIKHSPKEANTNEWNY